MNMLVELLITTKVMVLMIGGFREHSVCTGGGFVFPNVPCEQVNNSVCPSLHSDVIISVLRVQRD